MVQRLDKWTVTQVPLTKILTLMSIHHSIYQQNVSLISVYVGNIYCIRVQIMSTEFDLKTTVQCFISDKRIVIYSDSDSSKSITFSYEVVTLGRVVENLVSRQ